MVSVEGNEITVEEDNLKIPYEAMRFSHVYMNIIESGLEQLEVFQGLFNNANP